MAPSPFFYIFGCRTAIFFYLAHALLECGTVLVYAGSGGLSEFPASANHAFDSFNSKKKGN